MRTRLVALTAAAAGLVVGSAVTLGIALAQSPGTGDAERPDEAAVSAPMTVPVTSQVLVDSETLSGALAWADAATVVASDGVVTSMPVSDGSEVVPGALVVVVNDRPVVALHMRFGLWRDLVDGDSGADVVELHTALSELGLYGGDPQAPFDGSTRAALAQIDARLADGPLTSASVAAVDTSGSTLSAPGVGVGSRLGESTVSVLRHSDRLAVSDSGLAAELVVPGQEIEIYDAAGEAAWRGTVSQIEVDASRTLLTLAGDGELPAEPTSVSVTVESTPDEVLAVPRAAIVPHPDGTSTVTITSDGSDDVPVLVTVGLCARDLCEVTPETSAEAALVPGTAVLVP